MHLYIVQLYTIYVSLPGRWWLTATSPTRDPLCKRGSFGGCETTAFTRCSVNGSWLLLEAVEVNWWGCCGGLVSSMALDSSSSSMSSSWPNSSCNESFSLTTSITGLLLLVEAVGAAVVAASPASSEAGVAESETPSSAELFSTKTAFLIST